MSRTIFCIKLQKEAPGLSRPPYPGPLGEKIFQQVSKEAWTLWLKHQTLLINEHRLSLTSLDARKFLEQEMEQFFFGEGSAKPEGYTPHE